MRSGYFCGMKKKKQEQEIPLTELLERNAKMEVAVFLLENGMQEQGIELLSQAAEKI